jgi:thiamine-phosphate pyrophosphorylase
MTDERQGDALWRALERLPRGAAIVFRHYRLAPHERRVLYDRVRAVARRRGLLLVLAGPLRQAIAWRADGAHGRPARRNGARRLIRTAPAHNRREARAADAAGCDALFLSPVFATRSHPGARVLGPVRFGLLARGLACPVIALGGMTARRGRVTDRLGGSGWAAIDAWGERTAD